ncbi:uncharacterized protein PV09_08549 [Verruconis gallopava]|uniref:Regulatory factor Sgt1 n=1 Tax=Verruconis gallopava TaxID=253628 RepID=A0A0D1XC83_9PEZI|nr:uncharacterized protein PV09_08549 [Verruconis gallopava]KIV99885.1 hypothetical protein PV09_08549 [Verruconis gallopava]
MDIPAGDGLKWFGEGFDGFPKRLPDDTVEYTIYIVDANLNDSRMRSGLNDILKTANDLSKKLLKDYIWQREPFSLELKREHNRWYLFGRTNFGDSIADEWVIVFMLRELSKQFAKAWIRVIDSDGEFLLIEAANALPKWLNPEIADHRVWINNGQLRIIPLNKDEDSSKNLSLQQALDRVSSDPSSLIHSPLIEEEAFYRLQRYPEAIHDSVHCALVTVPRKLAFVLHAKDSLTSPAVEAFYLRDPISLRSLNKSSTSDLVFAPKDFVKLSVRFNKASYAQLKSQEFEPPKSWENAPFPPSTDPKDVVRRQLGLKLTCGFEMLIQDPQYKDRKCVREIKLLLEDLDAGDDTMPTDTEISRWPQHEDSDAWMDINFQDFERELSGRRSTGDQGSAANDNAKASSGFGDKAAQENLRRMAERFEKWMNDANAGPEGAEIELDDMDFDDDEDDDDGDSATSDSDEEDRAVSFDEDEFRKMMRQMMGMPDDRPTSNIRESDVSELADHESNLSEDEEIRLLSEGMRAELSATGVLDLNPTPATTKAVAENDRKGKGKGKMEDDSAIGPEKNKGLRAYDNDYGNDHDSDGDDFEERDVKIDYNLAYNILEAFKGQTGMAGPAGNMMSMLSIAMPRDESNQEEKK